MYKKEKIICIIFILFLVGPTFLFILIRDNIDTENYENRELAGRPQITRENLTEFPSDFDKYINDHVAFKNQFVRLNNIIDLELFKQSTSSKVIVGKDKWLFYKSGEDGDPIGCYQGTNLFNNEQLNIIKNNINNIQKKLEKQNRKFVLYIAPNKEQIYSEYMPEYIKVINEHRRVDQVVEYLRENTTVPIVYPKEELLEVKKNKDVFHKYDTHWNSVGAFVGTQQLVEELKGKRKYIDDVTIDDKGESLNGLSVMINLQNYLVEKSGPNVSNYHDDINIKEKKIDGLRYNGFSSNAEDKRKIMIIRDSFGEGMFEFVPKEFKESVFIHRHDFNNELMQSEDPDIVVYEMVERYLDALIEQINELDK